MPSRGRRNQPVGQPDPHKDYDYKALSRCVVQLKVRVANQRASAPSAAADLEWCISRVESGPPALQLAVSQATRASALVYQEQARQLSADACSILQSLVDTQDITTASAWPLLRPLLRLLLWVLPEHVPLPLTDAAAPQQPPSEPSTGRHSTTATTAVEQWKQEVTSSFVHGVATQPLASIILHALAIRMPGLAVTQAGAVPANSHGFRVVEECLAWFTVLSRLCVVALELHEDTSQLESADITRGSLTSGKPSLFAFLIPRLTSYHPRLVNLAWPISYWLRGCLQLASRVRLGPASQSRTGEQEFAGHFAPSPHMANATGLWGEAALLLQRLSGLVCQLATQGFGSIVKGDNSPLAVAWLHGEVVCHGFDAAGTQRLELSRHLASKLRMHLQGLTLMCRALPAESAQDPGLRPFLHSSVLSILSGAVPAVRSAHARALRTQDGPTSLLHLDLLPATAAATYPSALLSSMQDSDIMWPSRGQQPLESDEEWAKEWQGAAVAAAEAAKLLMHINAQSLSVSDRAKAADMYKALMNIALRLMPVLRPESPESFASPHNAAVSTAWASCLGVLLDAHRGLEVRAHSAGSTGCRDGDAIARAVLVDQVMPVLGLVTYLQLFGKPTEGTTDEHAAQQPAPEATGGSMATTSATNAAGDTERVSSSGTPQAPVSATRSSDVAQGSHQLHHNAETLLKPGSDGASTSGDVPSSVSALSSQSSQVEDQQAPSQPAGQPGSNQGSAGAQRPASTQPAVPITSTLSLLGAASKLLLHCALAECSVEAANHSNSVTCLQRSTYVADVLERCLSLSHAVTHELATWEHAKAQAPLLLVDALYSTTLGLCGAVSEAADWWSVQLLEESQGGRQQVCMSLWRSMQEWTCLGAAGGTQVDMHSSSPSPANVTRDNSNAAISTKAMSAMSTAAASTATATQQHSTNNADVSSSGSSSMLGRQHLHCPTFICELALKLWSLYADKVIVGETRAPASWLPGAEACGQEICRALIRMLHRLDYVVLFFTRMQHEDQGVYDSYEDMCAAAYMLASLTPAVPWASDAFHILSDQHRAALQLQLCSVPLIRVVCMLSVVGLLPQQQEQGVVELLGGTPRGAGLSTSSTSKGHTSQSSFFLLPEPESIAQARQQHGVSLANLLEVLLFVECDKVGAHWQASSLAHQLVWAFGAGQLPSIASISQRLQGTGEAAIHIPQAAIDCWQQPSVRDTYLSWMQASLRVVIDDVLSQHAI